MRPLQEYRGIRRPAVPHATASRIRCSLPGRSAGLQQIVDDVANEQDLRACRGERGRRGLQVTRSGGRLQPAAGGAGRLRTEVGQYPLELVRLVAQCGAVTGGQRRLEVVQVVRELAGEQPDE